MSYLNPRQRRLRRRARRQLDRRVVDDRRAGGLHVVERLREDLRDFGSIVTALADRSARSDWARSYA